MCRYFYCLAASFVRGFAAPFPIPTMRSPALGVGGRKVLRPRGNSGLYWSVLITTVALGLALFYYYLFVGLRSWRETHPESRTAAVVTKLEDTTSRVMRYLKDGVPAPADCPTPLNADGSGAPAE